MWFITLTISCQLKNLKFKKKNCLFFGQKHSFFAIFSIFSGLFEFFLKDDHKTLRKSVETSGWIPVFFWKITKISNRFYDINETVSSPLDPMICTLQLNKIKKSLVTKCSSLKISPDIQIRKWQFYKKWASTSSQTSPLYTFALTKIAYIFEFHKS